MLFILTPDQLVSAGHPIRFIKPIVEGALQALSLTFDGMYAPGEPARRNWCYILVG